MAVSLNTDTRVSTVIARGVVTYDEVVSVMNQLCAQPALVSGLPILIDGRGVTGAPSSSELRMIARRLAPLIDAGLGPIAILTDSTFVYGIARMFAVFAQALSATVVAFRSFQDAEVWLSYDLPVGSEHYREPLREALRGLAAASRRHATGDSARAEL